MNKAPGPYRTCVGCRERKPKKELWRIVCDSHSRLTLDRRQRLPGRGAYLCPRRECAQRAVKRQALGHALRRQVSVPAEFLENFESVNRKI